MAAAAASTVLYQGVRVRNHYYVRCARGASVPTIRGCLEIGQTTMSDRMVPLLAEVKTRLRFDDRGMLMLRCLPFHGQRGVGKAVRVRQLGDSATPPKV